MGWLQVLNHGTFELVERTLLEIFPYEWVGDDCLLTLNTDEQPHYLNQIVAKTHVKVL